WELVVDRLPEELAGLFVEAHHDTLVALDFRVARVVVVGADKDLAAGDGRPAVGLRAQLDRPADVRALVGVPFLGDVLLASVDEIPVWSAAIHRPVTIPCLFRLLSVCRGHGARRRDNQGDGKKNTGDGQGGPASQGCARSHDLISFDDSPLATPP